MWKTTLLLSAINLAAMSVLHASEIIQVEKLTKTQLQAALKTASDDTIIESKGEKKTKAQWRLEAQAKFKPLDISKLKELADERKAKFEAAAKALQDEQDSRTAEQNAQVTKEFDELKSR